MQEAVFYVFSGKLKNNRFQPDIVTFFSYKATRTLLSTCPGNTVSKEGVHPGNYPSPSQGVMHTHVYLLYSRVIGVNNWISPWSMHTTAFITLAQQLDKQWVTNSDQHMPAIWTVLCLFARKLASSTD